LDSSNSAEAMSTLVIFIKVKSTVKVKKNLIMAMFIPVSGGTEKVLAKAVISSLMAGITRDKSGIVSPTGSAS
jgi:hypothetical protein